MSDEAHSERELPEMDSLFEPLPNLPRAEQDSDDDLCDSDEYAALLAELNEKIAAEETQAASGEPDAPPGGAPRPSFAPRIRPRPAKMLRNHSSESSDRLISRFTHPAFTGKSRMKSQDSEPLFEPVSSPPQTSLQDSREDFASSDWPGANTEYDHNEKGRNPPYNQGSETEKIHTDTVPRSTYDDSNDSDTEDLLQEVDELAQWLNA